MGISSSSLNNSAPVNQVYQTKSTKSTAAVKQMDMQNGTVQEEEDASNVATLIKKSKKKKDNIEAKERKKEKEAVVKHQKIAKFEKDKSYKHTEDEDDNKSEIDPETIKAILSGVSSQTSPKSIISFVSHLAGDDPFLNKKYMEYAGKHIKDINTKNRIQSAVKEYSEEYAIEIQIGTNIDNTIKKYKSIGTPKELRKMYYKIILKQELPLETSLVITSKTHDKKKQELFIQFLIKAAGEDLKNRNISPIKQSLIVQGISRIRIILTIHKMFDQHKDFVKKGISPYSLQIPIPSISSMFSTFMMLATKRGTGPKQLESKILSICAKRNPILGGSIAGFMLFISGQISQDFFKVLRQSKPEQAFNNKQLFIKSLTQARMDIDEDAKVEIDKLIEYKTKTIGK
ncbi:MAG: hypothetical protein KAH32_03705 [Chlamydiia bacterium]|nr:hypothetical protein [Chlamydiia bacterium]